MLCDARRRAIDTALGDVVDADASYDQTIAGMDRSAKESGQAM